MAAFDPEPQAMDPEKFLNWSKPISNIPANESSATFLRTAGNAVEGSAVLADSTIKEGIKNDIYKKVDPLRDAYTASLQAINDGQAPDPVANPGATTTPPTGISPMQAQSTYGYNPQSAGTAQSLLPDAPSTAPIPNSLQSGLDKASVMSAAAKQNGYYNDTKYTTDITQVAKQLRAQFPGYRDYIDQHMSEATGYPIANAEIKNLQQDANRQAAGAKGETEKMQTLIRESAQKGYDGADNVYANYTSGKINSNQVMTWVTTNAKIKADLENKRLRQEVTTGDRTTDTNNVTDYAQSSINEQATSYFMNSKLAGGQTPAQMADAITDIHMHPERADDVKAQILGQQYEAARADYTNKTMKLMMTPGADGKSVVQKLGATAVRKMVDDSGGALFDASSKMVFDKSFGAANMAQTLADGIVHNNEMGILRSSIGQETANVAAFNKLAPQVAPLVWSNLTELGYGTKLYQFTASQTNKAVTQPEGLGSAYTFKQSIAEQKQRAEVTGGQGADVPGMPIKKLADLTSVITNPKASPEIKANTFTYFFDPKNMDTMADITPGFYDPAQRRWVQGREAAFATLTSPDVTAEAYKMKQSGHPEIWQNYKEWAEHEAGTHLIRNDLGNLDDSLKIQQGQDKFDTNMNFHISWDDEKHHIGITDRNGMPLQGLQASMLNMPYRSVTNINNVLDHIQAIAKAEGTNVDAYLYKTLGDMGGGYAAKQLMGAMAVANGGKVPVYPPISRFAPEERGPSVQDFVKNPTGSAPQGAALEPYQTRGVVKGNLSDSRILSIDRQDIPEGMSAREFLDKLNRAKYGSRSN